MAQIIYKSTAAVSYDGLLEAYKTTDVRPDGKIWDMYSNVTNYVPGSGYAATYKVEGDGYNREHSIPQSIFGSAAPMKSDLYHVYPTDGKINGVRSNYCFGEVGTVKTASKNNFSVLGNCIKLDFVGFLHKLAHYHRIILAHIACHGEESFQFFIVVADIHCCT